MKTITNSNII